MSYKHSTGLMLDEQVKSGMKTLTDRVKFVLLIGLILGTVKTTAGWRPFRIQSHNLTVYSLSDKVAVNGSVNKLDGISLYIDVKKDLVRPFIRFEMYVDSGDGLIDLKYVNETVDMCRFFRNKKYLPFMQIIYRTVVDQGNFPASCPIRKKLYKGENMKLDTERLPPTMPTKIISFAAIVSTKEGSTLKPLLVYRAITKIIKI